MFRYHNGTHGGKSVTRMYTELSDFTRVVVSFMVQMIIFDFMDNNYRKFLADMLIAKSSEKGFSKSKVAKMIGVNRSHLYRYLSEDNKMSISLDTMIRIIDECGYEMIIRKKGYSDYIIKRN